MGCESVPAKFFLVVINILVKCPPTAENTDVWKESYTAIERKSIENVFYLNMNVVQYLLIIDSE